MTQASSITDGLKALDINKDKVNAGVQAVLDGVTKDPNQAPGLVFAAIDKKGDIITANASGNRTMNGKTPMDLDTVFWIASCTKLLATIGCMQLVEQSKLSLDDPKHLYKHCPELEKVQVLQDDLTLAPKKGDITLRQLLTHTAGFGYDFFNSKLRDYKRPIGQNVFDGSPETIISQPLVNQPGERFEYGINIDWAGIYLERVTGQTLNDYLIQHILSPLGLSNINMFPTASMKANLAGFHQHWPGSPAALHVVDHPLRRSLTCTTDAEKAAIINSGGAGCFAKPTEYIQVLSCLLNDGAHPKSGVRILQPDSVAQMFTNQLPHLPHFSREPIAAAKPEWTNPLGEMYPQEGNPPQGWGLSFHQLIEPGPTGRGRNSVWWAGIANLFYWVDREKGVAGMIASQILPFGDLNVLGAWGQCEGVIYSHMG